MRRPEAVLSEAGALGRAVLAVLAAPLCVGCGRPLGSRDRWVCGRCLGAISAGAGTKLRRIPLDGARQLPLCYALEYTPAVASLIHEMKYGDKPGIGGLLAELAWAAFAGEIPAGAAVVPVPLHPARRRERGYNQSEILGRELARRAGARFLPAALERTRSTVAQAKLAGAARLTNVAGSIRARGGRPAGRVVVVDDVATTGSTLRECARALLDAGWEDLQACAIASRG